MSGPASGPIARLIGWSARRRGLVIATVAVLIVVSVGLLQKMPLDALPDLSDTQVILYSRWDRSPELIEAQVTYPIVTALSGSPKVKAIRGLSDFGYSYVYVIFQDGTDLYWARSRVLEALSKIQSRLPEGVRTELGPDASGVGWVYQYALVDRSGKHSSEELRRYQDWTLRYALQSVPGVSEVASIGGMGRQWQIIPDPNRLIAYGVTLQQLADAVRRSNSETGGRLIEFSGAEFMVRGRGYAEQQSDFERIVVRLGAGGVPVLLKHLARVQLGPDLRRGVSDLDGSGDVVGGIVVMRQGENSLSLIRRVKQRLSELAPSLPSGVEVVTSYDRSGLIERAIDTLRHELLLEMAIVALVIFLFLWHFPSAVVPVVTIPISVLLSFIPLYLMGITVNIMSLAGIAISIGVLVDGAIVEVENAYNRIHAWQAQGRPGDFHTVRLQALQEVGSSVFFSLLIIAVSFLPIFALVDQEGRLFKPLAWSKTLAMALAAALAVTLDPALRMLFSRDRPFQFQPRWLARWASMVCVGTYHAEERHPISRLLIRVYKPACSWVLRHPLLTLSMPLLLGLLSIGPFLKLGSEFMPPLNEGTILYMPTTMPGLSIAEASRLLVEQDRLLKQFPEVVRVFGKAGRAETATDPAPLSMMETTVMLRPAEEWRGRPRWYSSWAPAWLSPLFRPFWPDRIGWEELTDEMNEALRIPGVTNAWTMPIKARTDMLSTGIRTPIGIKLLGSDLSTIQSTGEQIERILRDLPGTRSVFAERVTGGLYLDIRPRREQLARYGLTIASLQETISIAIGGETLSTAISGRERWSIAIRYPQELRSDIAPLGRVLIATPSGASIPLSQVAELEMTSGPAMVRDENGFLAGYVFVDVSGRDIGSYVAAAKERVAAELTLPPGVVVEWSGQFENMQRVKERLTWIVPLTLLLVFGLLLANTGSWFKSGLVMAAVPFSAIGAIWLFWLLGYNVSIAAWVGMIALFGLDAETGVFMLMFLDQAWNAAKAAGTLGSEAQIDAAIVAGAVHRLRPKLMTVAAAFTGLLPILFSTATGADVMKRIAAPMIGGLISSFLLELLVYPAAYKLWRRRCL